MSDGERTGHEQGRAPAAEVDAAPAPVDLSAVRVLAGAPVWVLDRLSKQAREIELETGALVVEQHEPADAVWVLLEGSVQILLSFDVVGDLLVGVQRDPGSLIGWSAFREPYRYTDSARCEGSCRLLRLPRAAFEDVFARDPLAGARIVARVAATVDARLEGALQFL